MAPGAEAAKNDFHWSELESADFREYIDRLRASGVPEKTIRDLIIADVGKLYRAKLAPFRPKPAAPTNFWENRNMFYSANPNLTPEQREQMKALQKEQKELVETLLGKDVYKEVARDSGAPDFVARQFGSIPEEKRSKVTELTSAYQQARSDIYAKTDGRIEPEDQAEIKTLQRKLRADLATVLTPQELEEYNLRSSDIANNMRFQLGPFEPNEQEFRAIYKYKQALEDVTPAGRGSGAVLGSDVIVGTTPADRQALLQTQKQLSDELAQALSPDRLKEFQMMDRSEFRMLFDAGVSKNDVFKVADMKQQAEDAVRKVRQDTTLAPEQRTQTLQDIRTATETELANLLGARRAKAYGGQGGFWIRNLAPTIPARRP
jgi:hypothetical protein